MSSPGAIAFQLGPLVVRWYCILMATAIVVGLWLGHREARKEGLPADDFISTAQWSILAGLIGARIYEVIFNWDYYGQFPSKIIAVWEGGLAIHGGLIAGVAVGLAIGRWGNFFNEEAFGRPTNLPWKLYISPPHRPQGYAGYDFSHPTF